MQRVKTAWALAFVVTVTFLCFLPDLANGFVVTWDDGPYIVDNGLIRDLSGEMLRSAFLEFHSSYWAPLTWVSFALDHAVWGLDPFGFHLTNNAIHDLNTGLFFLVCRGLLRRLRPAADAPSSAGYSSDRANLTALLATLLYSIHPLRVESVAWATERKDVLSLLFGLGAFLAYLSFTGPATERPDETSSRWRWLRSPGYWLAVGLYLLSLLSKPALVTFPAVLAVLDWYPLRRVTRASVWPLAAEKLPFAAVAGVVSAFTLSAHSAVVMPLSESSLTSRFFIALRSIEEYLASIAWPVGLSPFHLHPGNIEPFSVEYLLPAAALVGLSVFCVAQAERRPAFLAAWLVFLLTLLPGLGSTQVSLTYMADRFTYVPALGVSLLAAAGIGAAFERAAASRPAVTILAVGVAALLLTSGWLTIRQISHWKDDVALWSRAIDLQPHYSGRAYAQRASGYVLKGDFRNAATDMGEAIAIARSKHYPRMQDLYLRLARIHRQAGELEGAVEDYTRALEVDDSPMRSLYLQERGAVFKELGREDLANRDTGMAAEVGSAGSDPSRPPAAR